MSRNTLEPKRSSDLRIIVSGLAALHPVGGMAWHYLQYAVGLARLGHDVYYHEDSRCWPYHPVENRKTADGSYSAGFVADFFERYAPHLVDRWHYLHLHKKSFGMERSTFDSVARSADLLLNISGANFLPESLSPRCVTVFIDTDPGYNQIMLSERFPWSHSVDRWCDMVAAHDRHFTYAERIHESDCLVPELGWSWKTTRMPVVMDLWTFHGNYSPSRDGFWTTVMTWNVFKGKLTYDGVEYKDKGQEFHKILDLPAATPARMRLALGGSEAPIEYLENHGWSIVDAPTATLSPRKYQRFIAGSRGELSVAKNVYVDLRTGWFSDRSTGYLASGRPVVLQDTGFSALLPVGDGLHAFSTMDEAVNAIQTVESNYAHHSKTAREIADACFGSDAILKHLIEDAMT